MMFLEILVEIGRFLEVFDWSQRFILVVFDPRWKELADFG